MLGHALQDDPLLLVGSPERLVLQVQHQQRGG
jgi:hypothetical protein